MMKILIVCFTLALSSLSFASDGRLSVASGDPVPETDITTSTLYLTGDAELTLALSSVHLAGKNYDVFKIDQDGAALCTGPAWSTNVARYLSITPSGSNLVNATSMTCINGISSYTVPAGEGVLVGGFRAFATGQTRMTRQSRLVWDATKPVLWPVSRVETASTWSYGLTLFRQANNNPLNQIEIFNGMSGRPVDITASAYMIGSGGITSAFVGIGLDTSVADSAQTKNPCAGGTGFPVLPCWARFVGYAGFGYHEFRLIERGNGTGITWVGTNGYVGFGYGAGLVGFVLQ